MFIRCHRENKLIEKWKKNACHLEWKIDESTARRQLKSPQSLSGRTIYLNLVTKWSWSWSWMTYCHLLWSHLRPGVQSICLLFTSWQSDHFWLRYRKFHIWPWKFKVKVMAKVQSDGHIWGLGVQSICLLLVSWQSDHFGWDIANSIFDLENSRLRSWPRSNPMVTSEP